MATALGLMSGGAPLMRKYQVNATFADAGVMPLVSAGDEGGMDLPTATVAVDGAGLTVDTATFSTTQGQGANSAEALVTVIINTDLIWRWRLSGGSTAGTALTQLTNTVEDTAGLTMTTGAWTSKDPSTAWGYSGANAGQQRKVITVGASSGAVLVPFDNTIAVNDVFLRAPYWEWESTTLQLTTDLTEADANIDVATGQAEWYTIGGEYNAIYDEGTTNSYVHMVFGQYFLNQLS